MHVTKDQIIANNKVYATGIHHLLIDNYTIKLFILTHQYYFIMQDKATIVGHQCFAHIRVTDSIYCFFKKNDNGTYQLISETAFFVNGQYYQNKAIIKEYDDIVFETGYSFKIISNILSITSRCRIQSQYLKMNT